MAEIVQDENPRRNLYRLLLADKTPGVGDRVKKYSFTEFENRLLTDEDTQNKMGWYLESKGIVADPVDFSERYLKTTTTPPVPKQKPTPVAPPVAIEEEEVEMPEPQPLVGSPEYTDMLDAQYGGMKPTLGATFAGTPAAFETKAQKEQEQISPVFKAQQLAFEDVPIAEEQRRSQKQFAKATKQQQQAAIQGGTGFELEQERRRKERGYGEAGADLAGTIAAGGKRIGENIVSTLSNYINGTLRAGLPEIEATDSIEELANYELYNNAEKAQNAFQDEVAKRNIQTSVLQAIEKGEYGKIPEATLYTIGDAAMQIIPAILTMGGSTYFQTLPQAYKDGVDAIAKEEGLSPEQVVASGKDAKVVAQISSGIQSGLEFAGANLVSSSIASRGGYKVMRDWLLGQGVNRNLARGASLLGVGIGEGVTEYLQEGTGQTGAIAAKSPTTAAFFDNLPKELFTPEAKKQRREAFVGGLVGGMGVGGGGQVFQSAMDRTLFEAPKIGKATQRPDMNIIQTDDKIRQRNSLNKAMESAIQANPEAEGQIRERYRKLNDALELTDDEVLAAYDGIAQLPPSPEKDRIWQNLEVYMEEKGIQPEATGMEAGLGEGLRTTPPVIRTVNPDFPPPIAPEAPVAPPVSREEMDANIEAGQKRTGFVFQSPLASLSQEAKSIISNVQRNKYIATAPVKQLFEELYDAYKIYANQRQATSRNLTTSQIEAGIADFENALQVLGDYISKRDSGKFVREYVNRAAQEVAPVTEAAPVAEEAPLEELPPVTEEAPAEEVVPATGMFEGLQGPTEEEAAPETGMFEGIAGPQAEEEVVSVAPAEEVAPVAAPAEPVASATEEVVSAAPVEEVAPAAPAPKGRKKKEAPVTPAPAAPETKFKPNLKSAYYISKGADEVYYTLREIGGDDLDVHVMNLSKDLNESKRKAKELIGEDVEFDEKSLGRDYNKIKADKTGKGQKLAQRQEGEGAGMNTLSFGKYNGKTIDEVFEIDKPYILYLNKEYSTNTVFQKGVRDNPKIKEFIEQSLAEKEQQRKNLENLTEIGGIKFDEKGVAKAIPIKGKIKYINNRMGPQGMYRVYILDTEYGVPVEVSGDIVKFADGKLEQGAELSFTANVQKVGDKFKVIGRKSEYTKPAETKEGKKAEAKEERKETSFKGIASFETAKGSVYTVLPDGRTQRFKTATKEQNEPQDLTVFVKFKDAAQEQDFLEGVQRSETSGTKVYVIDKQGNKYDTNAQAAGKDVRLALVKDGKVIDTAETSTTPKIGYNTFDQRRFEKDGEKYREAHLGNKVVKINEQTKTEAQPEAQPEAAPSFTSQQSSEAATAFDKAKTSKGFDKKYGKGAYKALSDITKNFDAIMDKVSDKIKQDCL